MCIEARPVIESKVITPRYLCGQPVEHSAPAERLARWRRQVPQVETDDEAFSAVLARSSEDLGALRIFDPEYPERVVVAAGAPWFMTVFGRDSLLTSWMALIVDPDLALGVLQTLGALSGKGNRPPQRGAARPHPARDAFRRGASLSLGGGNIYYGTADATPLFVMLLGELRRWGLAREAVDELLPNAERAPRVDRALRRRRRRRVRRVPPGHRPGSRQSRMEGLLGRDPLRRRSGRPGPHRAVRGAGVRLQRLPGPGALRP